MTETITIRISPTIQAVRICGELVPLPPSAVELITQIIIESVLKLEEPDEALASWAKNWAKSQDSPSDEPPPEAA